MTVQEELDAIRKLLRVACKQWGKAMPAELSDWWTAEQQRITAEKAEIDARRRLEIDDLAARITALNAKKAALEALLA